MSHLTSVSLCFVHGYGTLQVMFELELPPDDVDVAALVPMSESLPHLPPSELYLESLFSFAALVLSVNTPPEPIKSVEEPKVGPQSQLPAQRPSDSLYPTSLRLPKKTATQRQQDKVTRHQAARERVLAAKLPGRNSTLPGYATAPLCAWSRPFTPPGSSSAPQKCLSCPTCWAMPCSPFSCPAF